MCAAEAEAGWRGGRGCTCPRPSPLWAATSSPGANLAGGVMTNPRERPPDATGSGGRIGSWLRGLHAVPFCSGQVNSGPLHLRLPSPRCQRGFLVLCLFLYTLLHLPSEQTASLAFAQTTTGPHVSSDSHRLFAPDTHLLCRPELTVR